MIYDEKYNIDIKKNKKQKFLGEGSYGCVIKPGYNCKGNTNKKKNNVTKLTKINFYSKNELYISNIIKNIKFNKQKIYNNHFVPILDNCIVKYNILNNFDIDKCDNFLDSINDSFNLNINKQEFYLFTLKYINGLKIKKYLLGNNFDDDNLQFIQINNIYTKSNIEYKIFINNYLSSYLYLLKSISLMQKNNIIHNDLYNRNIMFSFKKKIPIVFDFGLSYNKKKFFKINNSIDIAYIHKIMFDYKELHFDYNNEKRFLTFIINNKTNAFFNKVIKSYQKNELNKFNIDFFIDDIINGYKQNEFISYIFEKNELIYYKKYLQKFYYKFLDKKKYDTYFKIIKEILPYVFDNTDLYSLTMEYIEIFYYFKKNNTQINNKNYNGIMYLTLQLFKLVLLPETNDKLTVNQMFDIINYLITSINNNSNTNIDILLENFYTFLSKNNINISIFQNKDYAFIDFKEILFNEDIMIASKSLNLKNVTFSY